MSTDFNPEDFEALFAADAPVERSGVERMCESCRRRAMTVAVEAVLLSRPRWEARRQLMLLAAGDRVRWTVRPDWASQDGRYVNVIAQWGDEPHVDFRPGELFHVATLRAEVAPEVGTTTTPTE